jgi:hypothetical protein|tara:strand:- start:2700 stop:2996 length:297 start_codon:yes stop_codon:yes gene_type:complete
MPRQSLLVRDALLSAPPSPLPFNPAEDLGLDPQDNETRSWLFELLTCKEAAAEIKTSPNALATFRCRGRGPAYLKHGGKVMYRRLDLLSYQQAGRVEP